MRTPLTRIGLQVATSGMALRTCHFLVTVRAWPCLPTLSLTRDSASTLAPVSSVRDLRMQRPIVLIGVIVRLGSFRRGYVYAVKCFLFCVSVVSTDLRDILGVLGSRLARTSILRHIEGLRIGQLFSPGWKMLSSRGDGSSRICHLEKASSRMHCSKDLRRKVTRASFG